jgi:hypothetical protein
LARYPHLDRTEALNYYQGKVDASNPSSLVNANPFSYVVDKFNAGSDGTAYAYNTGVTLFDTPSQPPMIERALAPQTLSDVWAANGCADREIPNPVCWDIEAKAANALRAQQGEPGVVDSIKQGLNTLDQYFRSTQIVPYARYTGQWLGLHDALGTVYNLMAAGENGLGTGLHALGDFANYLERSDLKIPVAALPGWSEFAVLPELAAPVASQVRAGFVTNTATDAAAAFHPGQLAAVSGEVSQASVLRSLRQAGTPESLATAKLISRGKLDLSILETDPSGRGLGGLYRFGTSEIEIYRSASSTPLQAAGYSTHEATHFMQGLNPRNYNLGHEFDAFRAQGTVDAGHWTNSLSDAGLYDLLGSHPVYRGVRPDPSWPR